MEKKKKKKKKKKELGGYAIINANYDVIKFEIISSLLKTRNTVQKQQYVSTCDVIAYHQNFMES